MKNRILDEYLRSKVGRHFAIKPVTCKKCGRRIQFEFTYRYYTHGCTAGITYVLFKDDYCKKCCSSREQAFDLKNSRK